MERSLNALWSVWHNESYTIQNQYTLIGYSIAALRSNFFIKELNLMLDAGLSGNMCPKFIFITHCHSDHVANLPYHLYGSDPNNPVLIYVPESVDNFKKYVESSMMLSHNADSITDCINTSRYCKFIPVTDGFKTELAISNNKKIDVEVVKCDHTVPCLGYGFSEKKNKIKEEYKNLTGKEIVELKKNGVDINNVSTNYFLIYIGDTSSTVLNNPEIYKYSTIMIECTFLVEEDIENSIKTKHMHWNHLKPYILTHPNNMFILYHFSQRYKRDMINDFFVKQDIPNVKVWNSN